MDCATLHFLRSTDETRSQAALAELQAANTELQRRVDNLENGMANLQLENSMLRSSLTSSSNLITGLLQALGLLDNPSIPLNDG
jgi:uncharacterized protein YlxW (UPF0749 family)